MKDTRPSRKTSRAQDNIRSYLADIANYGDSAVGRTTKNARRSRYKDFEKSEKQARKDHELLFEYDPITVNEELKASAESFKKASEKLKRINVA